MCKLIHSLSKCLSTSANLTLKTTGVYLHRRKVQEYIWECAAKECFGEGKTVGALRLKLYQFFL